MAFEASNSGGFGGTGPAVMTSRFGTPTWCMYKLREKLVGVRLSAGGGVLDRDVGNVEVAN